MYNYELFKLAKDDVNTEYTVLTYTQHGNVFHYFNFNNIALILNQLFYLSKVTVISRNRGNITIMQHKTNFYKKFAF